MAETSDRNLAHHKARDNLQDNPQDKVLGKESNLHQRNRHPPHKEGKKEDKPRLNPKLPLQVGKDKLQPKDLLQGADSLHHQKGMMG